MKQDAVEPIRKAGLRATKPRTLLLSYLRKLKRPQTVIEIAGGLKRSIDQVTVYRTIESFKKAGLVRELELGQGRPQYELADERNHHHHVVCTNCDKVQDFTGCDSDKLAGKALKQVKGFAEITGHSAEFFGLCNSCVRRTDTLKTR